MNHVFGTGVVSFLCVVNGLSYGYGQSLRNGGYIHDPVPMSADEGQSDAMKVSLAELRRTDPTRAKWCLERLVPLYEQQVKEHPTVLEHRLSLADTLNELALLRIDSLDTALRRDKLDPVEAVRQTQQAVTESKRAVDVLGSIITQAKQDIDRLRTTRPDVVERNEKLIRDLTPLLAIFKADQRAEETAHQRYLRLRVAIGQFDRQADAKHAQALSHLMVTAFDQPELINAPVKAKLDAAWRERIDLACQPVSALDAAQARTMSRWYTDLAAGVHADNDAKAAMLIRAHVYATAATEQNGPATVVDNLNEQLAALDWSPERITHAHDDLTNRLAYLFGPRPVPTSDVATDSTENEAATTEVAEATNTSDEPAAPSWRSFTDGTAESTTAESTTPTATATVPEPVTTETPSETATPDAQPEAPSTTSTNPHGWPTAICPECGRSYFPGWKREYEKCSRCRSGHRNIFDFGDD